MELSCKTEYALLALLELASHYPQEKPIQIRQIADRQRIPDRYLEQLLATLRRGGLVTSQRGAKGGYRLAREPWRITLLEAIACLEGNEAKSKEEAAAKTVEGEIVTEIWQEVRDRTAESWQRYTLQDVCDRRDARRQSDIMYYI